MSLIARHSFIYFAPHPSFPILSCRIFLPTSVFSLLYLFFQSSYLTILFLLIYPFHVYFLYTLSPSFPPSYFSSSTFRSHISIHCNLSFLAYLQLPTSLSFQPLFFHCSSLNTILHSGLSLLNHFSQSSFCSSYTVSHSNLTIAFLILFPLFIFISLCRYDEPLYHPVPPLFFLRVSFALSFSFLIPLLPHSFTSLLHGVFYGR